MKQIKLAVMFALAMLSSVVFANPYTGVDPSVWYNVTKVTPGSTAPGNTNVLVESSEGVWYGPLLSEPGAIMPAGATRMGMRFEFITDSYFSSNNQGHIAVGIRGDGHTGLLGRGIIIGNVTALAGDSATTHPASIAIESFWATGNAVYGRATEATGLENNTHYRVTIVSSGVDAEVIGYTLEKKVDGYWVTVANREVVDYKGLGNASPNLGGWFIAEVFSQHAWSYTLNNFSVWYE